MCPPRSKIAFGRLCIQTHRERDVSKAEDHYSVSVSPSQVLCLACFFLRLLVDKEAFPVLDMLYPFEKLLMGDLLFSNGTDLPVGIQDYEIDENLSVLFIYAEAKGRMGTDKNFVGQFGGFR